MSMRARSWFVRGVLVSSLALLLSACVAGALQEFGSNSCRTVYVLSGGGVQPVNSCGGVPREGLMAQKSVVAGADLPALLAAVKFEADAYYPGVASPADKTALTKLVNDAVRDVIAMPEPRDVVGVRQRLALVTASLDEFPAKDRRHAEMYLVLAWRTAGFVSESGLFPRADDEVLEAS